MMRLTAILLSLVWLCVIPTLARAHPYPDSAIDIRVTEQGVRFDIAVPAQELMLAATGKRRRDAAQYLEQNLPALRAYLAEHIAVAVQGGETLPLEIGPVTLERASDHHVGDYEVFKVAVTTAAKDALELRYDAIIREIPNHAANVRLFPEDAVAKPLFITIRYDFAARSVPPLPLPLEK